MRRLPILLLLAFLPCACTDGKLVSSTVETSVAVKGAIVGKVTRPFIGRAYLPELEEEVVTLVNLERAKNDLPALTVARDIQWLAREQTQDMAQKGDLTHHSDNGDLVDGRANRANIDWHTIAENIARNRGYDDPVAKALEGWMKSSGHQANILNPNLTETGVGVVISADGYTYITQVFIARMPK